MQLDAYMGCLILLILMLTCYTGNGNTENTVTFVSPTSFSTGAEWLMTISRAEVMIINDIVPCIVFLSTAFIHCAVCCGVLAFILTTSGDVVTCCVSSYLICVSTTVILFYKLNCL